MPHYFQIPSCTAKLWPGYNSGTQTHTHGQVSLYMPFHHFMVGYKRTFPLVLCLKIHNNQSTEGTETSTEMCSVLMQGEMVSGKYTDLNWENG